MANSELRRSVIFFFFQGEGGIRDDLVTGGQTCALPISCDTAFWLDKGTTLYHTLANYMRDVLFPAGYVEVRTPLIYNKALWETSGHWSHYRQNMFLRSEERRVGKEGRSRWSPYH